MGNELAAVVLSGNQALAVFAQLLNRFSKCFETCVLRLAMEVAKIYLLQDNGETPVSVNLVKREIGCINTCPVLI